MGSLKLSAALDSHMRLVRVATKKHRGIFLRRENFFSEGQNCKLTRGETTLELSLRVSIIFILS